MIVQRHQSFIFFIDFTKGASPDDTGDAPFHNALYTLS
nr:MAG TPA: hypothetical protein [Caudoviricetes sp.]